MRGCAIEVMMAMKQSDDDFFMSITRSYMLIHLHY